MTETTPPTVADHQRERIAAALAAGGLIDITTRGRKTGTPRRIELGFHSIDGRIYISGMPGRRGWYANVVADPHFTFHLKRGLQADLPAIARPITDPGERRRVLTPITRSWNQERRLDAFVASSPLIEVVFATAP